MEQKLWRMTPIEPLPFEISCYEGKLNILDINRFGEAKFADKLSVKRQPSLENDLHLTSTTEEIYNISDDTYGGIAEEYNIEITRERVQMSNQAVQELSIPVQPRKYLAGTILVKVLLF